MKESKVRGGYSTYYWLSTHPCRYIHHHIRIQILAKPNDSGSLNSFLALRTLGNFIFPDMLNSMIRVQEWERLAIGHIHRGGSECGTKGIIKVSSLYPVAALVRALDIIKGAVQTLEL